MPIPEFISCSQDNLSATLMWEAASSSSTTPPSNLSWFKLHETFTTSASFNTSSIQKPDGATPMFASEYLGYYVNQGSTGQACPVLINYIIDSYPQQSVHFWTLTWPASSSYDTGGNDEGTWVIEVERAHDGDVQRFPISSKATYEANLKDFAEGYGSGVTSSLFLRKWKSQAGLGNRTEDVYLVNEEASASYCPIVYDPFNFTYADGNSVGYVRDKNGDPSIYFWANTAESITLTGSMSEDNTVVEVSYNLSTEHATYLEASGSLSGFNPVEDFKRFNYGFDAEGHWQILVNSPLTSSVHNIYGIIWDVNESGRESQNMVLSSFKGVNRESIGEYVIVGTSGSTNNSFIGAIPAEASEINLATYADPEQVYLLPYNNTSSNPALKNNEELILHDYYNYNSLGGFDPTFVMGKPNTGSSANEEQGVQHWSYGLPVTSSLRSPSEPYEISTNMKHMYIGNYTSSTSISAEPGFAFHPYSGYVSSIGLMGQSTDTNSGVMDLQLQKNVRLHISNRYSFAYSGSN